jgi:glycosyltransferase involved in cell wall biosynthesis
VLIYDGHYKLALIRAHILNVFQAINDAFYRFKIRKKLNNYSQGKSSTFVSIVVTVHNKEKWLRRCLTSIQKQRHNNYELIIIQNGSSDNSKNILKRTLQSKYFIDLKKRGRLKVVSTSVTLGAPGAKNLGVSMAKADYGLVVDADNFLHPDFVSVTASVLDNNKTVDIVHTDYAFVDEREIVRNYPLLGPYSKIMFKYQINLIENNSLFRIKFFNLQSCKFRRNEMSKTTQPMDDFMFWREIMLHGGVPFYVPLVLFGYTIDKKNLSGNITCLLKVTPTRRLRIIISDMLLKQSRIFNLNKKTIWN